MGAAGPAEAEHLLPLGGSTEVAGGPRSDRLASQSGSTGFQGLAGGLRVGVGDMDLRHGRARACGRDHPARRPCGRWWRLRRIGQLKGIGLCSETRRTRDGSGKNNTVALSEGLRRIRFSGRIAVAQTRNLPPACRGHRPALSAGLRVSGSWLLRNRPESYRALRAQGDSRKRFASTRRWAKGQ
jgi:hypothetical protein